MIKGAVIKIVGILMKELLNYFGTAPINCNERLNLPLILWMNITGEHILSNLLI